MVQKRKAGWIQDINRKRTQLTKDMFHPIAVSTPNLYECSALARPVSHIAS